MKTRKQCFEDARHQFLQNNQNLYANIKSEAKIHANALGLTEDEFTRDEVGRAFGKYLNTLPGDFTVKIIEMTSPDEETKKFLLREYYQEISDALGLQLDTYLKENRITL